MAKLPYQIFQEEEDKRAKNEYKKIIKIGSLEPDELWEITDENFYIWIKKYYYPKLLQHFRDSLTLFEEWQKIWNLDDKRIMELGITSCIESKSDNKNIYKYIIERTSYNGKQNFVSKTNLDGKVKHGGLYFTYKYKLIEGFVSYFDWFKFQCKPQKQKVVHNDILQLATQSGIYTDHIQITLQSKFRMIKMGGITVSGKQFDNINTKIIEFANLSRLRLTGRITTQNKELTISNSYVDDLLVVDCEFNQVTFYKCKMNNLKIVNSRINTWKFIECHVNGEIIDSELTNIKITEGLFDVIFRDSKLYNVHGSNKKSKFTYKALKQAYKHQGEDALEQIYYLKEKEHIRKSLISQFQENFNKNNSVFTKNKKTLKLLKGFTFSQFKNLRLIFMYLSKSLNYHYWGYGLKPVKVLWSSVVIIFIFGILYFLQLSNFSFTQMALSNIVESINISISSFSTLGYFSDKVHSISETGVIIESVIGGLSIGAFIASASNMKF